MTRAERSRQRTDRRIAAVAWLILLTVGILAGSYLGGREGATEGIRHEFVTPAPWLDGWSPVTQELADALAEGESSRDWEACLSNGDSPVTIVCPDGYVLTY